MVFLSRGNTCVTHVYDPTRILDITTEAALRNIPSDIPVLS